MDREHTQGTSSPKSEATKQLLSEISYQLFKEKGFAQVGVRDIAAIPGDTDVLITHRPPARVLDFDGGIHYGANELLYKVCSIRPRLHLFGHIHAAFGTELYNGVLYSNAALVDAGYNLVGERIKRLKLF